MEDQCEVKRCRQSIAGSQGVIYSASKNHRKRNVCDKHWQLHCEGKINLKKRSTFK